MLKIGQNWGEIANYPPNAQQRFAPLTVTGLPVRIVLEYLICYQYHQ